MIDILHQHSSKVMNKVHPDSSKIMNDQLQTASTKIMNHQLHPVSSNLRVINYIQIFSKL